MQFPNLLNDRLSETSDNGGSPGSNRRNFLKTLGVVGVSVALAPTGVIANPVKNFLNPSPAAAWLASCDEWLGCVKRFVLIVAADSPALARRIIARLEASEIEQAPRYRGFHYRYAPIHAFSNKIDREEVICGNGFMVNLFPYYGVDCTCDSDLDMSAREMARVTNTKEMEYYDCVLAPAGIRTPPDRYDHSDYRTLLAKHYRNHDPEDFTLAYTRPMVSIKTGKTHMAYGINYTRDDSSNTSSGDVLITKDV